MRATLTEMGISGPRLTVASSPLKPAWGMPKQGRVSWGP